MMGEGWVMGYPPLPAAAAAGKAGPGAGALSHASHDGTALCNPAVGPSTNHAATQGNPGVLLCDSSNQTPSHQPASKDHGR